jgi:NO-binding membrane sensor protein with MHYT domain
MNTPVVTQFDLGLVALSFLFAVIGSFVALTAAGRVKARDGRISLSNLVTVGVALGGIGVWSMHFIGMLALRMDVGSSYAMTETFVSLAVVVVAASLAVRYAAHHPDNLPRLAMAGTGLGLSVVVMHYLGMFGLKIYGFISWDLALVGLSVVIAVVASTVALWLAFNTPTVSRRVLAALAMGVAVCAMHYTGMAAAEFVCTTDARSAIPQGDDFVSSFRLPSLVIVTTVLMTLMLSLDQGFQYLRQRQMRAVAQALNARSSLARRG